MEIQTKDEIVKALENVYGELAEWIKNHDDQLFGKPETSGKWSAGQHAEHVAISSIPLRKGLSMPKIVLRTTFGVNKREERSYNAVVEKYHKVLAAGGAASGRYVPSEIKNGQKAEILEKLDSELYKIKNIMNEKWDGKKMSKFILPHPLLGKMTVRELMFFMVYHTGHHLKILRERY